MRTVDGKQIPENYEDAQRLGFYGYDYILKRPYHKDEEGAITRLRAVALDLAIEAFEYASQRKKTALERACDLIEQSRESIDHALEALGNVTVESEPRKPLLSAGAWNNETGKWETEVPGYWDANLSSKKLDEDHRRDLSAGEWDPMLKRWKRGKHDRA